MWSVGFCRAVLLIDRDLAAEDIVTTLRAAMQRGHLLALAICLPTVMVHDADRLCTTKDDAKRCTKLRE